MACSPTSYRAGVAEKGSALARVAVPSRAGTCLFEPLGKDHQHAGHHRNGPTQTLGHPRNHRPPRNRPGYRTLRHRHRRIHRDAYCRRAIPGRGVGARGLQRCRQACGAPAGRRRGNRHRRARETIGAGPGVRHRKRPQNRPGRRAFDRAGRTTVTESASRPHRPGYGGPGAAGRPPRRARSCPHRTAQPDSPATARAGTQWCEKVPVRDAGPRPHRHHHDQ